jgi:hypothetical protein
MDRPTTRAHEHPCTDAGNGQVLRVVEDTEFRADSHQQRNDYRS